MDLVAPADPWIRFRRVLRNSLSSTLQGQRGHTRELPGMVSHKFKNHAHLLIDIPGWTGSGGEAGCVPQGLKALTGPPVSSSPHIDCILVAKASKGPNGLNFTGPMVIFDSWTRRRRAGSSASGRWL